MFDGPDLAVAKQREACIGAANVGEQGSINPGHSCTLRWLYMLLPQSDPPAPTGTFDPAAVVTRPSSISPTPLESRLDSGIDITPERVRIASLPRRLQTGTATATVAGSA